MKNQMLLDTKILRKGFLTILGVGLLIMAVSTLIATLNWTTEVTNKGMIDIYDVAYLPFVTLFPLLCIIPCLMLFEEN